MLPFIHWKTPTTSCSPFKCISKVNPFSTTSKNQGKETYHLLYAFGAGSEGQLGLENREKEVNIPKLITALSDKCTNPILGVPVSNQRFIDVRCGWTYTFAVNDKLQVFGWGNNQYNQLSPLGHYFNEPFFIESLKGLRIFNVACGRTHTLFLNVDHQVFGIGHSQFGQVGTGDKSNHVLPQFLRHLKPYKIVMIDAGLDHSIALSEDGTVFTWGWNEDGQGGHSHFEDIRVPTKVQDLPEVARIASGHDYCAVLTQMGQIYTWGNSEMGQMGVGSRTNNPSPELVEGLSHKFIQAIACGGSHMLALTEDQEVFAWGCKQEGQLGIGDVEVPSFDYSSLGEEERPPIPAETIPIEIESLQGKKICKIAAGGAHNLALSENGDLYCWGFGENGRLGLGDSANRFKPTLNTFFSGKKVVDFACGTDHTIVVVEEKK